MAALLLAACNPLDDVYQQLDDVLEPYREDIEYTLTEADYAAASTAALKLATNKADSAAAKRIKSEQAFNATYGPENLVPAQLGTNFKALNKKSSAKVTYNMKLENLGYIDTLLSQLKRYAYTITDADYSTVGGAVANVDYFVPSMPAAEHIPTLLADSLKSAKKGDYAYVSYKQSNLEPASGGGSITKTIFFEDFEAYNGKDTVVKVVPGWHNFIPDTAPSATFNNYFAIYDDTKYDVTKSAQFSAYKAEGQVESWLITPIIPLPADATIEFQFDCTVGNFKDSACVTVWYSTNYNGIDAATATWHDISSNFTFPRPASGYSGMSTIGKADLSTLAGNNIAIAFKYVGNDKCTPAATATYRLDNVKITATTGSRSGAKADLFEQRNDVYHYDGTKWAPASKMLAVQPADYKQMGLSKLSADQAKLYLPMLLATRFPFAMEGDTAIAVYNAAAEATRWTLKEGRWAPTATIEQRTIQFIHNGSNWVFDPAVNLVMAKDDYQIIVDYIRDHPDLSKFYDKDRKNAEYYYGFSAYYGNVSFALRYREPFFSGKTYEMPADADPELSALASTDDKVALMWKRTDEAMRIFLERRFPDAVPQVSGVDVFYHIQVTIYAPDGGAAPSEDYLYTFRCTGSNPATFEFVEKVPVK